ncbi:unnamed protein product [Prunus armeniaca]
MWQQRSRVEWLKEGAHNIEVITDMVNPKVPDQMKHFFAKPYSRDEVAYALKKMPPSKAPRIDGMLAFFFQEFWHILGDDIVERQISDNIILAFETIHAMRSKMGGKSSKDCFEVGHGKSLVYECISIVSYSLIRHGAVEDDSLLFLEATPHAYRTLKRVFEIYESVAGQKINLEKLAIAFSPNTPVHLRNKVSSLLKIPIVEFHEKYLGLPTVIGKRKKDCFNGIKERLRKKLNGWKEKLLLKAGKALLIKAVAHNIPNYAMGVFKLPITFCADLNSMISKFWWKNSEYCKAGKERASSYVWRSLIWGRELLLSGLRKRIGDGQDTLDYGDAWIPRPNFFCS